MYTLEVKNLSKQIDGKQILSNVTFKVEEGEIMALVGPNGAGKTTTLKCIMNAVKKDSGEIFIFEKPFHPSIKKDIAFVTEHRKVFNNLQLADYYKLYKTLYPSWDDMFFKNFLSRYGFNLNEEMQKFSRGQKTLILAILAFSTNAKLIILDEPTQHLDPAARFELIEIIKQYVNEKKGTILLSSHEIFELEEYATSFAIIKDGKILYTDSIDEAKQKHRIVSLNENIKGAKVIAVMNNEVLVQTEEDIGEYPRLNQIIVGYLKST
ncbi:MAG: ABC transporter related [Caldanaerobacter subterraneus]|jgi:ABC-2 type transport system ATP-binding protein|uniref:ABC transporter related n=2 Tax=Thermoanaerobacter TaxID=1754 RepID=B0KCD5_THEP3|nr:MULTISPECIES: ATP-binding cassette domain-containing protein [Thermoanaerobacter]KUJ90938.1 MAG: ABC transporter-like protein [Thermoanaerobacter thermocopriae]KUK35296.1 MAG: ABC transporter related [Caldanaerobacter subterraneus]SFE75598.1 ABC-2 type transport system ATP-binding protein [Thermoanaerobacter thermohydrosulfuricus]ABY95489.1 ABC transporter related [Thermoanaerobacter pseudethanolicus ATCC 33223]ADV80431.1 ABC transporter related protein [Thermoanaerobacter brockii subsp. fi